jgi:hypothetical protein
VRIKMDVQIDVDKVTALRFLAAEPQHRWKMMDLISNTRPDAITYSEPVMFDPEAAPDETPPASTN